MTAARPIQLDCPSCGRPADLADHFCEACGLALLPVLAGAADHLQLDLGLVAGVSDRGLRHRRNEDALALARIDTERGPVSIAVVCDGISSADRPDEASLAAARTAARTLAELILAGTGPADASNRAVQAARAAVEALAGPGAESPAATFISAVLTPDTVTLCWLGDSRGYWLDARPHPTDQQLTTDDSLAAELVAQGQLAAADALSSPEAHVVTRWIGTDDDDPEPHLGQFSPSGPGVLLLCSDGLWNYAPEAGKLAALAMPGARADPARAAAALVQFAIDAGGMDNITVALAPFPPA